MNPPPVLQAYPLEIQENEVIAAIIDFVERNRQRIWEISGMKGGWEGWLQVELAMAVSRHSSHSVVEREKAVFQNASQFIDLWCTHRNEYYHPMTNPSPSQRDRRIGVELKCGGEHQDFSTNVVGNFQTRVIKDIQKIMFGMNPSEIGDAGARVYAVGITAEFDDLYGFESVATTGMQPRYWRSSPLQNTDSLYVLWWYRDFRNGSV